MRQGDITNLEIVKDLIEYAMETPMAYAPFLKGQTVELKTHDDHFTVKWDGIDGSYWHTTGTILEGGIAQLTHEHKGMDEGDEVCTEVEEYPMPCLINHRTGRVVSGKDYVKPSTIF
jgi:hypothetical protein